MSMNTTTDVLAGDSGSQTNPKESVGLSVVSDARPKGQGHLGVMGESKVEQRVDDAILLSSPATLL